jgi:hypothetical protein
MYEKKKGKKRKGRLYILIEMDKRAVDPDPKAVLLHVPLAHHHPHLAPSNNDES